MILYEKGWSVEWISIKITTVCIYYSHTEVLKFDLSFNKFTIYDFSIFRFFEFFICL